MSLLGKWFKSNFVLKKSISGVLSRKFNLPHSCSNVSSSSSSSSRVDELKNFKSSEKLSSECSPILHRNINFSNKYIKTREIWVENVDAIKEEKKGLVKLNSNIFGVMPRLDLMYANVKWQMLYRKVVLHSAKTRAEMRGSGRKPHPQKGLGKARQGSLRAPHMINGGVCHGPRNPTSYFYMISFSKRLHGLISTLSVKFAQDDLHIVDNLNIPSQDSEYILDLIKERNWGPSVLMVNDIDTMPRNITLATENLGHVTLMPLYGLNVYGMLKHDTLIMTLSALNDLENKLTMILNSATPLDDAKLYNN